MTLHGSMDAPRAHVPSFDMMIETCDSDTPFVEPNLFHSSEPGSARDEDVFQRNSDREPALSTPNKHSSPSHRTSNVNILDEPEQQDPDNLLAEVAGENGDQQHAVEAHEEHDAVKRRSTDIIALVAKTTEDPCSRRAAPVLVAAPGGSLIPQKSSLNNRAADAANLEAALEEANKDKFKDVVRSSNTRSLSLIGAARKATAHALAEFIRVWRECNRDTEWLLSVAWRRVEYLIGVTPMLADHVETALYSVRPSIEKIYKKSCAVVESDRTKNLYTWLLATVFLALRLGVTVVRVTPRTVSILVCYFIRVGIIKGKRVKVALRKLAVAVWSAVSVLRGWALISLQSLREILSKLCDGVARLMSCVSSRLMNS